MLNYGLLTHENRIVNKMFSPVRLVSRSNFILDSGNVKFPKDK